MNKRKKLLIQYAVILLCVFLSVAVGVIAVVTNFPGESKEVLNPEVEFMKTLLPESLEISPLKLDFVPKVYSFAAVGDCIVHTNVYKYASQLAAGTDAEYDFKPMFANIKDAISSADIAYINQETPSAGKERGYSGYPTFNTPDEIADAIVDAGFDIVNIANNHMLDKGEKGYLRNINFWSEQPVLLIGGYKNAEDYDNIRMYEMDNLTIAWLSYTYGTNGLVLPSSSELVVPLEDADEIDRQTRIARELADLVFVSIHWGYEDNFKPSQNQQDLAKLMANNCVDAIIGTHPHVLQKIEWLERPDGKRTLCAYSLGNIISTMMYGRNMLGGLLSFDICETSEDYYEILNVELQPTMTYYKSGFSQPTIYFYKDFTEQMQQNHGAHRYDSSMSTRYLNNIIKNYIPREFIRDPYYDFLYEEQ